jgi:transposase
MPRLRTKHDQTEKPAESETQKLIRQTRQATTKRYSAEDKIRIVMEGIRGELPISALCRREGIHANLYYRWLKDFMEAGKARLKGDETRGATRAEVEQLQRENERLRELVANLSLETLVLKKSLL